MCRWMGSHFHNWTDYRGVEISIELLEWGGTFSIIGHRIDYNGVRALRGQRHISSKNLAKYLPKCPLFIEVCKNCTMFVND